MIHTFKVYFLINVSHKEPNDTQKSLTMIGKQNEGEGNRIQGNRGRYLTVLFSIPFYLEQKEG